MESLPHLSPQAFHYFLPGYMLACLDDWEMCDMIPYGIISIGGHRDDATNVKEEAREKRKKFTAAQRRAIAFWLRELSKYGPLELRNDEDIEHAATQILENWNSIPLISSKFGNSVKFSDGHRPPLQL